MIKVDELIEELKNKRPLTRDDVANLLTAIGEPGKNQPEKIVAVAALDKVNFQGVSLQESLKDYSEY